MSEQVSSDKNINELKAPLNLIIFQLSWKMVIHVIKQRKTLIRAVTSGGMRIIKKNRSHILKILENECIDDEQIRSLVFSSWFNEQEEYFLCLNSFFESTEHKELLSTRNCGNEKYVLDERHFHELVGIIKFEDIDIFLFVSPICFTTKQVDKLTHLKDKPDRSSAGILNKVDVNKQEDYSIIYSKSEKVAHENQLRGCNEKIKKTKKEMEKLRNNQSLQKKEIEELKSELVSQKTIYNEEETRQVEEKSKLCFEIENLERTNKRMEIRLRDENKRVLKVENKLRVLEAQKNEEFYKIISRIDAEELLANINASEDVIELLKTVVQIPETDCNNSSYKHTDMKDFWSGLLFKEDYLINRIFEISIKDVIDTSFDQVWAEYKDFLEDLKYSLYARIHITELIHNILFQYLK